MTELKGSKTEKNLLEAFAGESQARNRYSYFAAKAREEGHEELGDYFDEIAINEMEHAKKWFKILCGGKIFDSKENLRLAIGGENAEWSGMYPRMAKEALEDGFDLIAGFFDAVGKIEKRHEENLKAILDKLESGVEPHAESVEEEDAGSEMLVWICRKCGHVVSGVNPPAMCAVCERTDAFYQSKAVIY